MAGLLAGFALVAILLPLDHEAEEPDPTHGANAVVVYASAFFSLLILSIGYAVLAGRVGEGEVEAVAVHEQMLIGVAFGLSTLLLLLGLHAVLRTYGVNREVFAPARELILTVTSVLGPVLVLALQFSNTLDLQRYRAGGALEPFAPGVVANLVIVGVGSAAVMVVARLRDRLPEVDTAPRVLARSVLFYTFGATLWAALAVPLLPVEVITSAALEHGLLGLTALGVVGVSVASWAGR